MCDPIAHKFVAGRFLTQDTADELRTAELAHIHFLLRLRTLEAINSSPRNMRDQVTVQLNVSKNCSVVSLYR
jgi:hypothetical protein